jgi:uncharacterized protein YeaO (DUF488 family)
MTNHARIRLGRIYDERVPEDGARILVDRLWPRGLAKDRADLDEWCKQVAPSSELRSWFDHHPDRFTEFRRRYETELRDPERAEALDHLREVAQETTLTLLTATRDVEISAAAVLVALLAGEDGTDHGAG